MRGFATAIFFVGLICNTWYIHKATKHRKDPSILFYLGNVDEIGRKYVRLGLFALLVSFLAFVVVVIS